MSKRVKTWNTPKKHRNKVYAVGYFKGHLTKAVRKFNGILKGNPVTQMHSSIDYAMRSPKRMNESEMNKAERAGLNVNRATGYINGY